MSFSNRSLSNHSHSALAVGLSLAAAFLAACNSGSRRSPAAPTPTFTVTYHGNGSTSGSVPVDTGSYQTGATVTLLAVGDLSRDDYEFAGWNTQANGSGDLYNPSGTLEMGDANLDFYAQWTPVLSVTLVPGDGQVTVRWSPVPGASSYHVYHSTTDSLPGANRWNDTVGTITGRSATITGLANDASCFVWVASVTSGVETFLNQDAESTTPSNSIFSPVAAAVQPGENALEVALDKLVVVPFNQQLLAGSVTTANVVVSVDGTPVAIDLAVGSGGDSIEISPHLGIWEENSNHTVTIGEGLLSSTSSHLSAEYSFQFRTLDNASLIGRWVFNNSGVDVSGNDRHAGVTGASYDPVSRHEGSHSLALDGSSVVDIGTFPLGDRFTYTAWVNVTDTSQILTLFANGTAGFATDGIKVFVNEWSTNNRRIIIESGNGIAGKQLFTQTNFVTFGAWFHVAVTIDRTLGEAYLYFNGEQATTYDSVSNQESNEIRDDFGNAQQTYLNQFPGGNFQFVGNLDDVRFYNRVLSANEIRNIANEN